MFLDKQTGQDAIDAYQAALDEHVAAVKLDIDAVRECMPTDAAGRRQAITELATNIILHIKAAAEQVVGRTRVIPGRCQRLDGPGAESSHQAAQGAVCCPQGRLR